MDYLAEVRALAESVLMLEPDQRTRRLSSNGATRAEAGTDIHAKLLLVTDRLSGLRVNPLLLVVVPNAVLPCVRIEDAVRIGGIRAVKAGRNPDSLLRVPNEPIARPHSVPLRGA